MILYKGTKMIILESRRPDFVWVEWVLNTFPFYNLAPEL